MKQCTGCSTVKPYSDYYEHPATRDGFASKCKECAKAVAKASREKNADKWKEYDRARAMRPDRVAARKEYIKTEGGKAARARATAAYYAKAPERRAAQVAVGNAIRDGRIVPWPVCAVPDCCNENPEAHHPDYSRPLDVVWLCKSHHKQAHDIARNAQIQS